jgi:hypothetical protein
MKRNRIILAVIAILLLAGTWYAFEKIAGAKNPDDPIIMFISPHEDKTGPSAVPEKEKPKKDLNEQKVPEIPKALDKPVVKPRKKPKSWPSMGAQPLRQIVNILKEEQETTLGYRPDDLLIGKIIDNRSNRQRGEVWAVQAFAKYFAFQPAAQSYKNEIKSNIVERDLEKFWFPSGKKSIEEGTVALDKMADNIAIKQLKIPGNPETLKGLLEVSRRLLAGEHSNLTSTGLKCMEKDNIFYHSKGTAIVTKAVLSSSLEAFATAVSDKKVDAELKGAIFYMDKAIEMDPFIVLAKGPDSIFSNHLSTMTYYFDQSEDCIIRAIDKL